MSRVPVALIPIVALVTAVAASAATAQDAAPPRPAVTAARPFEAPTLRERTLPSGLQIVVARHGSMPKLAALLVVKGAGLASDPAGRTGLAAFTADAVLEGTTTRTSEQIRREAFGMGGSVSATSGQDFSLVEIRGLSEYMPDLLALLADIVMHPSFPEDEIASLRTRQLQALLQQRASPQFLSHQAFRRALFRDHPYARVTAEEEDLEKLDRAAVAAFHGTAFRPGRATLIVVGDVAAEEVFRAAEKMFAGWKGAEHAAPSLPAVAPLDGQPVVFVQRPGSVQSSISFGNLTVARSDPRWYTLYVTNALLGGSFNSRLTRKLREEKGYTYSPFSQLSTFAVAGFYRFAADVRNEVTGAAIRDMRGEIERLQTGGVEPQELEDIKQYARGLFSIRMAAQDQVASDLVTVVVFGLPRDYLSTYQSKISAVSAADVKAGAGLLVTPARSVLTVVGDWNAVKDQLADYEDITLLDPSARTRTNQPTSSAP